MSRSSPKKRQEKKNRNDHRTKRQASIIKDIYDGESVGENLDVLFNLAYFDL